MEEKAICMKALKNKKIKEQGVHCVSFLFCFSPSFFHIAHFRCRKVCVWEVNELFRLREMCLSLIHDKDIMEKIDILKRIY